eukprot:9041703-Heterocapsa_arctica.AAC.1
MEVGGLPVAREERRERAAQSFAVRPEGWRLRGGSAGRGGGEGARLTAWRWQTRPQLSAPRAGS